jgi:hypothetical protein
MCVCTDIVDLIKKKKCFWYVFVMFVYRKNGENSGAS